MLLLIAGFAAEALLLSVAQSGIFQSAPVLGPMLLFWFWMSIAWALWAAASVQRRLTQPWPAAARILSRLPLAAVVAFGAFVYFGSWASYQRMARFASLEAIRFALVDDRDMVWFYVKKSEPVSLLAFGALTLAIATSLPFYLRWLARSRWTAPPARHRTTAGLLWCLLTVLCGSLLLGVSQDTSVAGRQRIESLQYSLSPFFSLISDSTESLREERQERRDAAGFRAAFLSHKLEAGESSQAVISMPAGSGGLRQIETRWAPPSTPGRKRPSIVFFKIESLRHDAANLRRNGVEVMPNLNALARAGVRFTRAYAPATHTDYSDVSTLSSLYPLRERRHHYYQANDPWPKTLLYDLLKPVGYDTALISAEDLRWGDIEKFVVTPRLDFFYDPSRAPRPAVRYTRYKLREIPTHKGPYEGDLADEWVTDVALSWLRQRKGRPFFLNLDLQSSHFPYSLPPSVDRPFQPGTIDFDASFVGYPFEKTEVVRNAYYNAIHECDRQLGRLVAELRALGRLDDTILVIYGDHGEAFNENGQVTHGFEPIEPVIRTLCVVHAPGILKPGTNDYPIELTDLAPTILGLMGWPPHPNFQGIDVFKPDRPPAGERLLFFHVRGPYTNVDALLLGGRWKYSHDRRFERQSFFDLAADPNEKRNLAFESPALAARLESVLGDWRRRQLAYYSNPAYYSRFYPPAPPRWAPEKGPAGKNAAIGPVENALPAWK